MEGRVIDPTKLLMINPVRFCSEHLRRQCSNVVAVMRTPNGSTVEQQASTRPLDLRPSALAMVSDHELQTLRTMLAHGALPTDFETKLIRLAEGDLTHRFIQQNCRVFVALLLAAWDGAFKASQADCERLLRVLAYVRKDDDAIADYKPGGFVDDQQEVRAAIQDLYPLLASFKSWRLRHQVPQMWVQN